jgi:hypothetical protein
VSRPVVSPADVVWKLHATDSFDREAPASCEAEGRGLVAGLELLWRKYLGEGVNEEGTPTFTDFELSWGEGLTHDWAIVSVKVYAEKEARAGAAKLRAWGAVDGLLADVAAAHERLLHRLRKPGQGHNGVNEAVVLLELASRSLTAAEFQLALATA